VSAPTATDTLISRDSGQSNSVERAGVGRWLKTAEARLGLASVLFGVLVSVAVLAFSGGIPFVTDGNESFATYNHGANLLRFGLTATMGLTDEVSTPDAAAHPYIYTHQGNLPRFASALLLWFGVNSMAWHVILISLIGGAFSTALCFHFFARAASARFAGLVCFVFWTDYLLFVQWQANSFRVWHSVLLFGGLVCAQSLGVNRRLGARLGLLGVSACLFYFELIFAVFTVVFIAIYSLIEYRRQLRLAVMSWALMAVGGGASLALLATQLLSYAGPEQALQDVQVTYLVRNFAGDIGATAARAKVLQFFMENHVVFWDSFDTTGYMSLSVLARTLSSTVFVVYSPLLVTLTGIVLGSLAIGTCPVFHRRGRAGDGPRLSIRFFRIAPRLRNCIGRHHLARRPADLGQSSWLSAGLVARCAVLVVSALLAADSLAAAPSVPLLGGASVVSVGFPRNFGGEQGPWQLFLACTAIIAVVVQVFPFRPHAPSLAWRGFLAVLVVSLAVAAWLPAQRDFYPVRSAALWRGYFQATLPPVLVQVILVGAWVLGSVLMLSGSIQRLVTTPTVRAAGRYVAAGTLAFLAVYLLSPGYLYGGYLSRYAPLPVFVTDVTLALLIYVLLCLGAPLSSALLRVRGKPPPMWRDVAVGVLATVVLVFVVGYWARVQATYIAYMPPGSASFLQLLEKPPFQDASFASNNYALPITTYTGSWAYQDHILGQRRTLDSDATEIEISGKYMWFRDRDENMDYLKPHYYLCRIMNNLDTVADLLVVPASERIHRCSSEALVQGAGEGNPDRLVASDPGRADGWAIVELDPSLKMHPTWRDAPATPTQDIPVTPAPATPASEVGAISGAATVPFRFRTGFYSSEGVQAPLPRWTDGLGVLEIYPPAAGELVLVLDVVQPDFGTPRAVPDIEVSADDRAIPAGKWTFDVLAPGNYTVRLPLLARSPGGAITVTLHSGTFVPIESEPGSVDRRRLGVRIEGIRLEKPILPG